QVPVPGLRYHGQKPRVGDLRVTLHRPGDDGSVRHADRMCVGDAEWPRQRTRLRDPGDTGHLSVAVLAMEPGGARVPGVLPATRMDRGDPGPDRIPLDQGGVADLDPRNVGDGVPRSRDPAERDSESPGSL